MDSGLIGGLVGGAIGLLGGVVGTYFSIKNASGPKQRTFMIQISIVVWVAISLFLAMLFILPADYKYIAWLGYGILLPWGVSTINKTLKNP